MSKEQQFDKSDAVELLRAARCPNKDCENGAIPYFRSSGDLDWEQCQWCDERKKLVETTPSHVAPHPDGNKVCPECGGRLSACNVLGHRPESDRHIQWQTTPSTTPLKTYQHPGEAALTDAVQEAIRKQMVDFGEIPDRNSPDDFPEGYVLTREEIVGGILNVLEAATSAASATPRSEPFGWYGMMSNGDGTESPRFESGAKPWCLKDMRDAKPLYLRLPLNLGEPINHARLEAILWRWGSGTVTLDCDDQGRFRLHVEHAEAADEVYVHAEQEGVLDAAIAATANNRADGGKQT